MSVYTTAETGLYLIAACLPSTRGLVVSVFSGINISELRTHLLGSRREGFFRLGRSKTNIPQYGNNNSREVAKKDSAEQEVVPMEVREAYVRDGRNGNETNLYPQYNIV